MISKRPANPNQSPPALHGWMSFNHNSIPMNRNEAFREAVIILKAEANELALMRNKQEPIASLPHRAQVAIQREIDRLRYIADHIESAFNESEISDENA